MQHLDTFVLFSSLPPELRIKIFQFALPGPRVLEIRSNGWHQTEPTFYRTLSTRPPALLSVCRESREVALMFYKPSAQLRFISKGIYLNSFIDTVYLKFGDCSYQPPQSWRLTQSQEPFDMPITRHDNQTMAIQLFLRKLTTRQTSHQITSLAIERLFYKDGWENLAVLASRIHGLKQLLSVHRAAQNATPGEEFVLLELNRQEECEVLQRALERWDRKIYAVKLSRYIPWDLKAVAEARKNETRETGKLCFCRETAEKRSCRAQPRPVS